MRARLYISILVCAMGVARLARADATDADVQFFESKVRPVLVEKCFSCHSAEAKKLKAELYLDSREGFLKGGESGPALVPGKPEQSRVIEAVGYKNVDLQMPPKERLSDAQIADLTTWVKRGAIWGKASTGAPGVAKTGWSFDEKKGNHWAWKPVKVTPPPAVKDAAWSNNTVDRFLLAGLEAKGLKPAGPADRRALIRRASFDLTGLPPTPAEVAAFVADTSPNAWEKVIDRLLASPHFGERWARHWMDLVRYAEGHGHEFDYEIKYAWRYRDYLIRAFNADVPYNDFVTEHVAGDLMERPRMHPTEAYSESIIATGFWFLGEQVHAPVDARQDQADRIDNQVDVMGKTFLAMTLGCARCHDHKFDPIPQKDVYGLWGYLEGTRRQEALLDPHGKIHAGARRLDELRRRGSELLGNLTIDDGAYLSAACEVVWGEVTCEELARRASLDATRLQRWADALKDQSIRHPTHPLFTLWQLTRSRLTEAPFAKARVGVAGDLIKRHRTTADALADSVVFKDFKATGFKDWYVTGEAFGAGPTRVGEWDVSSAKPRVVDEAAAESTQLAPGLAGVLRSPDFIIEHDTILTRCAGNSGRLRLIVDNYQMGVHSGLLFGEHQPVVNTPEVRWVRQYKDVERYRGHRAHLEIIDDGGGWIAVEEIRFANTGGEKAAIPPADVSAMALAMAGNEAVNSMRALTDAYAAAIQRSTKPTTTDEAKLLNWAIAHDLVDVPTQEMTALMAQMAAVAGTIPEPMRVLAAADGDGVDERLFIRGSPKNLGDVAPRAFLRVVSEKPTELGVGSGRLALARQLVDPGNPLISRVIVNRLWHHLFGRGIVASTDNFGALGTPPTHPELLDFLADRFVREGWSIKRTLRELMLTQAYQMSAAAADAKAEEADPQNLLLHRANVRRLESEAIRDEILAVSGRLDAALFGPSVPVYLTAFMDGRGKPESGPVDGAGRRSIYLAVRRNFLSPMLLAFDTPIPFSTMGRRSLSNVPAQALILMNDPFVQEQAGLWGQRIVKAGGSVEERVRRMYEQAFARPPTDVELSAAREYFSDSDDAKTWGDYGHVLMNLKEFIFLK